MNSRKWVYLLVLFSIVLFAGSVSAKHLDRVYSYYLPVSGSIDVDDLILSTYIGGYDFDDAKDVAVGADGSIYVTGYAGAEFPVTPGAFQVTFGGDWCDAFVAKLAPDGKSLVYATYLGGSGSDIASAISVDNDGAVYVVGETYSVNFPTTTGTLQPTDPPGRDGFVVKLSPDGTTLEYATYLGGSGGEGASDIVIDTQGNAYVVGTSRSSADFPTTAGAYDPSTYGLEDAFVVKLNADGSALHYGTFIGGVIGTMDGVSR